MKKTAFLRRSITTVELSVFAFMGEAMAQAGQVQGEGSGVGTEIANLYNQEIAPIINVVVAIAIIIAAVYAAFMFFQGKREGYKTIIYIVVGALLIKFLPELLIGIIK
jgi:hypothetical protein